MNTDPRNEATTWDQYHRIMSGITAEIIGAARYFDEHPEHATDARLADTFWDYARRIRAVETPS